MTLSPSNCQISDMLYANGTAVTDACVIDVVEIIDTNKVSVKVYPLYEGGIDLIMTQGQAYNFIDFKVPFQITPTTVFYSTTHKAAQFKMCDLVSPLAFECIQGEYPLSRYTWKWDHIATFIQGEYWAHLGTDRDDYVTIGRISSTNAVLESIKMAPCKLYTFSTGHKVYVTDIVAGWTPNCRITVYPLAVELPTLHIDQITSAKEPTENLPQYNRYGVSIQVIIKGTGVGNLKLSWGTDHDETIINVVAGIRAYEYTLPVGTHNICAELFNIETAR